MKQALEDQREENNLPKLHPPQNQGRMLVIDEASAASELRTAKHLVDPAEDRIERMKPYLHAIQEFAFRYRPSRMDTVVEIEGKEIEDLKWKIQRVLDLT